MGLVGYAASQHFHIACPRKQSWPCRLAKKLVYGKIRGALGVSKCVVSGGGSLQPHLDEFYEVLDLTVLNGWGLSEVCSRINWPCPHCSTVSTTMYSCNYTICVLETSARVSRQHLRKQTETRFINLFITRASCCCICQ